ncbi:hypothetical protein KC660_03795 [Candidatus Dojkabacteria bacterium]|uniref:Uncharacterized protein n=1 Tax=Candidatus Dojkabacteria bacterium TaxID=2099670 RepID=A0A955L462_9BACT|nr:hypothetical protein [Candidatus Dojkabacteria bacterium]
MDETKICPKCEGQMMKGFIVDRGHYNGKMISTWIKGWKWGGLTVDGKQTGVMTYKCEKCGFLESYAVENIDKNS